MPHHPPTDRPVSNLAARLAGRADAVDLEERWPAESLADCAQAGVYRWFVPRADGGDAWDEAALTRAYLDLSAACLTTTFIVTQQTGALRRIAASPNARLRARLFPKLLSGAASATLGISHLTTSRRHLARPALRAVETGDGFLLDGYSPWVTGARHADTLVLGATLDDGRELLAAVDRSRTGVNVPEPEALLALSGSDTGAVRLEGVEVSGDDILFGPIENVMAAGAGGGTGGLQTSTLAVGLAGRAIAWLRAEAERRPDLLPPAAQFEREQRELAATLLTLAAGENACPLGELRGRANHLVLRATQAALAAAKGAGYVRGHPAGRWCREALFFLVWSCPQPVVAAHLCSLAGLEPGE